MTLSRMRIVATALAVALLAAAAITAFMPKKYAATARVLLPPEAELGPLAAAAAASDISISSRGESHLVVLRRLAADPAAGIRALSDFVGAHTRKPAMVIDQPSASHSPVEPALETNLLYGAIAGLLAGLGWIALGERRARIAQAAEPAVVVEESKGREDATPEYRALCERLLKEWFVGHPMLALVGAGPREERAKVAARLAVTFSELGAKTLVADAEMDGSQAVQIKPAEGFSELYLLLAPRERLAAVVSEASRRFRVVLIEDSDLAFAKLAGGALIIGAAAGEMESALAAVSARVLGTVV